MHNLLSRSQFDEWRHLEQTVTDIETEDQKISDYYECLIECDVDGKSHCKKICKELLF
jgi:hypothetical protein